MACLRVQTWDKVGLDLDLGQGQGSGVRVRDVCACTCTRWLCSSLVGLRRIA